MDCHADRTRFQVALTESQIRGIFAAINTAGLLSRGRVRRRQRHEAALVSAIERLERASGIEQAEVEEWVLD